MKTSLGLEGEERLLCELDLALYSGLTTFEWCLFSCLVYLDVVERKADAPELASTPAHDRLGDASISITRQGIPDVTRDARG